MSHHSPPREIAMVLLGRWRKNFAGGGGSFYFYFVRRVGDPCLSDYSLCCGQSITLHVVKIE